MPDALAADKQPFAVWLVPQKYLSVYLSGVIHYLCEEYETAPFEPHCTIVSGTTKNIHTVITETDSIVPNIQPVTCTVQEITCSESFFKTLFIRFRENSSLIQVFRNFKTSIPENHTESFSPHLSLLYKEMAFEKKEKIASNLEIPLQEIIFDSVKIVIPKNKKNTWYDISSWETVFERKLTGK